MYLNDRYLKRFAEDRTRDLRQQAEDHRQLAVLRLGLRRRLALALIALAKRLEPGVAASQRDLARF